MSRAGCILLAYIGVAALALAWFLPRATGPLDRFGVAQSLIADGRGAEAVHLLDDRVWRGAAEFRATRYRRAVEEFAQGQGITALYNLGTAYARLGEWAGARAAYERTLALDPGHGDAAHNLALVRAAEDLQQREAQAQRDIETLGTKQGNDRGEKGEETGDQTTVENAEPSVDTVPTERMATRAGQIPTVGRTGEEVRTDTAAAGRGSDTDPLDAGSEHRAGSGAIRRLRTSAQDTEILLRAIEDDPRAVLRARLWSIDRQRRERGE